ncbi:ribosomal protein L1p/L10e family protein [Sodiomyces alkalinus F11]|uniref:Ribosomal protein L1p/L10e family protein n=1 Tax=Sodiomyces alkalinus (strain CBS 110278 / VKM F-3762 / F11) TaxID=1314773 RepID=A0A3N2PJ49_SODAK|nr:ribosomal protein L1p/L10e family protein [Sodiomyces alkalinus F11]ROT34567.1 ribosomal protein L1p/L10e family protein [Sodiomyces alkalinus F11]
MTRPKPALVPRFLVPAVSHAQTQTRGSKNLAKMRELARKEKKKKKLSKEFKSWDPTKYPQFSLCDAMRYLRAYEVGRPPTTIKYELAVRLKTPRNGPVIKGRVRFPHSVKTTDVRVAVICPDNSEIAQQALQAGAVLAGQESLFEAIRNENITFNRLICHTSSEAALNKAGLGRILGPKGLMPNKRMRTITDNVVSAIRDDAGADEYRERSAALRIPVGQLGFTPKMLAANVKTFMTSIKQEIAKLDGAKEIREVVLSSSHGPGFNLNGLFDPTDDKVTPEDLSHVM